MSVPIVRHLLGHPTIPALTQRAYDRLIGHKHSMGYLLGSAQTSRLTKTSDLNHQTTMAVNK